MAKLTPKQEAFCRSYHETGNASEAYRTAYDADGSKPETVHSRACELLKNGEVAARLAELSAEANRRHQVTIDDLIAELNENRQAALAQGQTAAANGATMGKAKLLGLDKQIIKHEGLEAPVGKVTIEVIGANPKN